MKQRAWVELVLMALAGVAGLSLAAVGVQENGGGPSWALISRWEETNAPLAPMAASQGEASGETALGSVSLALSAETSLLPTQSEPRRALFSASRRVTETLSAVAFDASASWGEEGVVLYEWDWNGDGVLDETSAEAVISHTFADDGVLSIYLRVSDARGGTAWSAPVEMTVLNRPPVALPRASSAEVEEGETVDFTSSSTDSDGSVASWTWDFGDGTTCSSETCAHVFLAQGSYEVRLVATDEDGASSVSAPLTIVVHHAVPTARFRADPAPSGASLEVLFVDTSTVALGQTIVHVAWDFGDKTYRAGGPLERGTYSHVYASPGVYRVTLFVIDADGAMSVAQREIVVPR